MIDFFNYIDNKLFLFAHFLHLKYSFLDSFFISITDIATFLPLSILSIILIINKKTRLCGLNSLDSLITSTIITTLILKNIVKRPRPFTNDMFISFWQEVGSVSANSFSFPSGHSSAIFAICFTLFLYFNKKYSFVFLLIALIIAFSRVYLFVHYATDVIAGILIGIFSSLLSYTFIDKMKMKEQLEDLNIL